MSIATRLSAAAILALSAGASFAQPSLMAVGMGAGDISANGNAAAGQIYDATQQRYVVYTWTRGVGAFRTEATMNHGIVRASADVSALSYDAYNLENYGGFGTNLIIAHRWTQATGSVNLGLHPNATVCDYINYSSDISATGRYVVGSGWINGCTYRAWTFDSQTNSYTQLPISLVPHPVIPGLNSAAKTTRADSVSGDGTVTCGYDENYNAGWTSQVRRATVWTNNAGTWTETVLDANGGDAFAVNTTGNVVIGRLSPQTMQATFSTSVCTPVKWTRQGNTWVPQNLGGDASMLAQLVSADGNTVVGPGGGGAAFIWRPTINGGVPTDLQGYVASLGGNFPGMTLGSLLGPALFGLSDDGNEILSSWLDNRDPCLVTGTAAILYLNGVPCEQTRIDFSPVSQTQAIGAPLPPFGIILNTFASGSWPLNYQWQKETAPGVWNDLNDGGCPSTPGNPATFDVFGSKTRQLRLGSLSSVWAGNYRCVVTNPECGTATTAIAVIGTPSACYANCDNSTIAPVANVSDFICFLNRFAAGDPWANCDGSTFTPSLTVNDFVCFLNAYGVGCR